MSVDAGTIYAEIRVGLDKLHGDVSEVKNKFSQIGKEADKQNVSISKSAGGAANNVLAAFQRMNIAGTGHFAKMARGIGAAIKGIPVIGWVIAIIAVLQKLGGKIVNFIKETSDAYRSQQKELITLNTAINSTGAAAWTSARQMEDMAQQLAKTTGQSVNDIMKMQSKLLAYTNITGENFHRTSKAAADLAAATGGDLSSAADTLGKALNNPIEGLSSLTQISAKFRGETAEQIRKLAEQGEVAKAQALILETIEADYKNVAAAQETAAGMANRLKNVQEELNAEIGKSTSGFTNWWTSVKLARKEAQLYELRQKRIGEETEVSMQKIRGYVKDVDNLKKAFEDGAIEIEEFRRRINDLESETIEIEFNFEEARSTLNEAYENVQDLQREVSRLNELVEMGRERYRGRLETQRLELDNARRIHRAAVDIYMREDQRRREGERLAEQLDKEIDDKAKLKPLEDAVTAAINRRKLAIEDAREAERLKRIDTEEMNKRMQSAYTEEANQLTTIQNQMKELNLTSDKRTELLTAALNPAEQALNISTRQEAHQTKLVNHAEALRKISEERAADERTINLLNAQRLGTAEDIFQAELAIAKANLMSQDYYKNVSKPMQDELLENLEKMLRVQKDTTAEARKQNEDDEKQIALLEAQRRHAVSGTYNTLMAVRNIEREIALEKLQNTDRYINASKEEQERMIQNMDGLQRAQAGLDFAGMMSQYRKAGDEGANSFKRQREEAHKAALEFKGLVSDIEFTILTDRINDFYDELEKKDSWEIFAKNAQEAVSQIKNIFSTWSDSALAWMKRDTENQKRELDQKLADELEYLDDQLQARLYAAGLATASTKEEYEQDLNNAILSGDHRAIYEKEQALKKYKIEKDIADKREAIEKKLNDEKKELDHQLATAQWKNQLIQAGINAAQAQLNIWATVPKFDFGVSTYLLAGAAAAISAAEISAITAQKPQKFADGGIVSGSSFRGDNIIGRLNSNEEVLTSDDRVRVRDKLDQLDGQGGGKQILITIIQEYKN